MKTLIKILLFTSPLFFIYYKGIGYFSIYTPAKEILAQAIILILFALWFIKGIKFKPNPLNIPLTVFFSLFVSRLFGRLTAMRACGLSGDI